MCLDPSSPKPGGVLEPPLQLLGPGRALGTWHPSSLAQFVLGTPGLFGPSPLIPALLPPELFVHLTPSISQGSKRRCRAPGGFPQSQQEAAVGLKVNRAAERGVAGNPQRPSPRKRTGCPFGLCRLSECPLPLESQGEASWRKGTLSLALALPPVPSQTLGQQPWGCHCAGLGSWGPGTPWIGFQQLGDLRRVSGCRFHICVSRLRGSLRSQVLLLAFETFKQRGRGGQPGNPQRGQTEQESSPHPAAKPRSGAPTLGNSRPPLGTHSECTHARARSHRVADTCRASQTTPSLPAAP